jgi:hypothetical protein
MTDTSVSTVGNATRAVKDFQLFHYNHSRTKIPSAITTASHQDCVLYMIKLARAFVNLIGGGALTHTGG